MPEINSPYFNISYGWDYGEDGWNTGMDTNLLRLAFLARNSVQEFVTNLPESPSEGYSCILRADNLAYFRAGASWVFAPLEVGYEFTTLVDGKRWARVASGYAEVIVASDVAQEVSNLDATVTAIGGQVEDNVQSIENLEVSVSGIYADASGLPVTSDSETMPLDDWMSYVRDRQNHTGEQDSSTITNFEGQVLDTVGLALESYTLAIETNSSMLNIEYENSVAHILESDSGVLTLPDSGGVVVELTEDITEVVVPSGEFDVVRALSVRFIQDEETPYTVTGWPTSVEWTPEEVPTIDPALGSSTVLQLIDVGNRGWIGWREGYVPDLPTASDILTSSSVSVQDVLDQTAATIDERMPSAARIAVNALDANTATLEDLILALQTT